MQPESFINHKIIGYDSKWPEYYLLPQNHSINDPQINQSVFPVSFREIPWRTLVLGSFQPFISGIILTFNDKVRSIVRGNTMTVTQPESVIILHELSH